MSQVTISNDKIQIVVNSHGAELISLKKINDTKEAMWCGNPMYWGRVSPVLFPFVGKLKEQKYKHNGKTYNEIPQHGFARDSEFEVIKRTDDTIWFELVKNEKWQEKYPFRFTMRVGYRLEETAVHIMWKIINEEDGELYFSIGAHPAFACDDGLENYLIDFNTGVSQIKCELLNKDGLIGSKIYNAELNDGMLMLTDELFEEDVLIMNGDKFKTVTLKERSGVPVLQIEFDAPQLGIWSPAKKQAPFVCIEPWYGRCDRDDFEGELSEREYGNILNKDDVFEKEYAIRLL